MANLTYINKFALEHYNEVSPADFIFSGDGGFWYDYGDWDSLFQDTAMTIPVTAAGQRVAAVMDKGANNFHLVQPTLANRPYAAVRSGKNCVRFIRAQQTWMMTPNRIAFRDMHGWISHVHDADYGNFGRMMSTASTNTDTDLVRGVAAYINIGTSARRFNYVGDPASNASNLGTTKAVFEYSVAPQGGSTRYIKMWVDNVLGNVSNTIAAQQLLAASDLYVGVSCRQNLPYAPTTTCLDGYLFTHVHLGTLPDAADQSQIEAWINTNR